MSFLDVICCGFGAMVLLVLLSKTDVVGGVLDLDTIEDLLSNINAEKRNKTSAGETHSKLVAQTGILENQIAETIRTNPNESNLEKQLDEARDKVQALKSALAGGQSEVKKVTTDAEVKVGGIPVDSDHIIFIVDTSGSMIKQWARVLRELENVLDVHPQVTGFQIMNGNGKYLIKSYAGRWIPDTKSRRKGVLILMKNWRSFSDSNPVEGLEVALKTYAKRTKKLAIYIFGDDYPGGSYDSVLARIEKLNRDPSTKKPLARIHGIGFLGIDHVPDRFAVLMREVARRNRGAFVALGADQRGSIISHQRANTN